MEKHFLAFASGYFNEHKTGLSLVPKHRRYTRRKMLRARKKCVPFKIAFIDVNITSETPLFSGSSIFASFDGAVHNTLSSSHDFNVRSTSGGGASVSAPLSITVVSAS